MKTQASNNSNQRGSSVVEFALTLPVMVLLFAGFLELGIGFSNKAVITDASRAAVREIVRGGSNSVATDAANAVLKSAISWDSSKHKCDSISAIEYAENCDKNKKCCIKEKDAERIVILSFPLGFPVLGSFVPDTFKDGLTISGKASMQMIAD